VFDCVQQGTGSEREMGASIEERSQHRFTQRAWRAEEETYISAMGNDIERRAHVEEQWKSAGDNPVRDRSVHRLHRP
jgi:hypothetical protein